jgi:flagellar motor switch protein FliG
VNVVVIQLALAIQDRRMSALLHNVDANVLAVALVGSREEFIDRICDQMPKRTARAFRRELRRVGPTRLSDVETAQRMVADTAARDLAARRQTPIAMA